jgi:hypothetical protein
MAREDDDERRRLEQEALGGLLGADSGPGPLPGMPDPTSDYGRPNDQPTSNTMPIGETAPGPITPAPFTPPAKTAAGDFKWNAGHDFSAFDTQREQDPAKSAKDAFAMLSNQAPPPPLNDKNALAGWFKQYIQPGMDQLGHKVSSVDGDKFSFNNWQGNFDVDYGEGAGGDRGRLSWQTTGADDATKQMYAPGGTPAAYQGSARPANTGLANPFMPAPTGDDPLAAVQAEIEALMANGKSTPMEADALRKLLEQQV